MRTHSILTLVFLAATASASAQRVDSVYHGERYELALPTNVEFAGTKTGQATTFARRSRSSRAAPTP
jgi:hypothetical protein